jgi:phage gp29-like protein
LDDDGQPVPPGHDQAQDPPAFAEGGDPPAPAGLTATLAIADRAGEQADQVISSWVDQVRQLFANAGSLEEARDRLIDLYPDMSGAMFSEVMSQALTVANLAGRVGVKRG